MVPTVPHLYVMLLAAPHKDYLDKDFSDEDKTNAPVRAPESLIPTTPSRTPSSSPSSVNSVANKSHARLEKSMAGWDICKMMCLGKECMSNAVFASKVVFASIQLNTSKYI
jgi:hypothetical protein